MRLNRVTCKNVEMKRVYLIILLMASIVGGMKAQETLSLSQAIEIGLQNNYDLRIIRNDQEVAHRNNTWGNAGALPSVNFTASVNERFNFDAESRTEDIQPQVGLDWVVFNGFSARITKRRYEELERLSQGNTVVLVENTIEDIISAYNQCVLQQEMIDVYARLMKLSEDRYDREMNSKKLGASTTYDGLLAKTVWLEDKSTYLNQQVTFENAVRSLNFLLGVHEETMWKFTTEPDSNAPEYRLADLIGNMESNNNTLKNQYINQSLLAKETQLAKSNFYPSLSMNAGLGHVNNNIYYSSGSTNDITNSYTNASVGLNLSYNIFSGGQRATSVRIAKIQEESGMIEIEQMKHSLENQLHQIYSTYEVQKELLSLAIEQEDAAHLNLDIATDKLKNGSMDSFDFRNIQINYLNASIQRFMALYNLIDSKTSLQRLSGGLINEYDGM